MKERISMITYNYIDPARLANSYISLGAIVLYALNLQAGFGPNIDAQALLNNYLA